MENNMIIFEYNKENPTNLARVIDNFALVSSGNFDIGILASSAKMMDMRKGIHIWINSLDTENANLMILLSFICTGHPDLKKTHIEIFAICRKEEVATTRKEMRKLVLSGRLPITEKNINIILKEEGMHTKTIISQKSINAGLTLIGLREEMIKHEKEEVFKGYEELGTILFVHSKDQKTIH
jgi:hypothetical protein